MSWTISVSAFASPCTLSLAPLNDESSVTTAKAMTSAKIVISIAATPTSTWLDSGLRQVPTNRRTSIEGRHTDGRCAAREEHEQRRLGKRIQKSAPDVIDEVWSLAALTFGSLSSADGSASPLLHTYYTGPAGC